MRIFVFLLLSFSFNSHAKSPNILIIYVDDLGYGDTAVYGHPVVQTPNIDQLAAEGVRFSQFYAPSALCSPSRAGMLTGRTPYRTGVESWIPDHSQVALRRDEFTIAQMVKPLGYSTAVIGKWHLNGGLDMKDAPQPKDFGFDHQYGLAAWVKNEKAALAKTGKLYPDNMYRNNIAVGETDKFSAELVSDEAIGWLKTIDTPFLLLLTYSEVHVPIASPEEYLSRYDLFRTEEAKAHPDSYHMNWADRPSRGKGEYYANITYLDAQMGRVIDHLKKSGQLDDTLVIFSSDNGPVTSEAAEPWELNVAGETDGLRGKKRYLFEGGIRVPGIFRWPNHIPAGVLQHAPATSLDILPTIADYLEIDSPLKNKIDGQSIKALLDGNSTTAVLRHDVFYWSIPTPDGMEYAVREGGWKLILDPDGVPTFLFNVDDDRYEINNLIKARPELVLALKLKFDAYRADVERH